MEELKIYMLNQNANGKIETPNKNLKFSQSLQYVLGYDWLINDNFRLMVEPYYQYLYNIPGKKGSSYSLLNFNQDLSFRDSLENNCKGENYGIDFTLERFMNKGYYFLVTSSIFKSTYKADDGIWRNTRYNKGYVINLLVGKEFNLKNNRVLGINGRFIYTGGERYSPVLMEKSLKEKDVYYDESKAFEAQMPATKYLDLSITYRINKQKHSSVWALQVKNVLLAPMYEGYNYYYKSGKVENQPQAVLVPSISYKIEF
jgi:hypothetical protein